ncbi:hypothetical protein FRC09_008343 [Ceratobasidium sp. 395]|nr:hypothetical protein FRC09_008343 [Ceratobasidium sp. 395]
MGMGMGAGAGSDMDIPPPTPPPPEPESEPIELSQESQVKRYVSLGPRAARPALDWTRLPRASARAGGGDGQRTSGVGVGPRAPGVGVGQRGSGVVDPLASAVGVDPPFGGGDEDKGSPNVSFEGSKNEPTSPEERRKNRWGFFKKVSMDRLRSHRNAQRLGHRTPTAQVGNMPDMPSGSMRGGRPSPMPIPAPAPTPVVPPPRVDVTSAGSPASSVLTARALQAKSN